MKYSTGDYVVTKEVEEALRHKISDFALVGKTRDALHVTLVTTYGLKANSNSSIVQSVVTAEDLFAQG